MRSFTIASVILAATAALASPLTGLTGRQSEIDTTFRFLGSVYCLVHTDETVYSGPCPVSQQVQLQFEGLTALTEVLGHSINVTRVPVSGPYGNYYVTIDGVLRNPKGFDYPSNLFGAGITRSYDYPL